MEAINININGINVSIEVVEVAADIDSIESTIIMKRCQIGQRVFTDIDDLFESDVDVDIQAAVEAAVFAADDSMAWRPFGA